MDDSFRLNLNAVRMLLEDDRKQSLRSVYQIVDDGFLEVVVLQCDTRSLLISANPDDDTISVSCRSVEHVDLDRMECVSSSTPWRELLGTGIDAGWLALNQNGYCDTLMLSLGFFMPRLVFYVIGSAIRVSQVFGPEGDSPHLRDPMIPGEP